MTQISLSKDEKQILEGKLKAYLREKLDVEIGGFDAAFLLDFLAEELGPYFYNRGLYDARAALDRQLAQVDEAIYGLEKPTGLGR